ncbi:unnamed protein product [Vitrella brassicaformis CCMP3155]|uniref:D-lactate dehydrogenase n=1 Tax=Vitrella brassicaformis (strain CCMP3155) TaxID=1169540 RepID=A0A0G4G419_VITBC|nr:unnamed protein product [Vitrella brassicaformis CCMP3155]|eukprot:CEM23178.1 unnamed protein product [Vitrella brassicaformis CCMP3155]
MKLGICRLPSSTSQYEVSQIDAWEWERETPRRPHPSQGQSDLIQLFASFVDLPSSVIKLRNHQEIMETSLQHIERDFFVRPYDCLPSQQGSSSSSTMASSPCKVAFFSAKDYDKASFTAHNHHDIDFEFINARLTQATAGLAKGCHAVCVFINDEVDAAVVEELNKMGVRQVALRCAGFNNVDLAAAERCNITVTRVPAYSPHAVAEHAVGLMLCLNRNLHRAFNRVRDRNFTLDGLEGMDFNGKTFGFIGTGKIGCLTARICSGFGANILGSDPYPDAEFEKIGGSYAPMVELLAASDVISLHCPLTAESRHLIDHKTIGQMKTGVIIINTSRGPVINSKDMIEALKSKKVGGLAIDVYEGEAQLFFEDWSNEVIQDDVIARLLTFPNVLVTAHQAFFTYEALEAIAKTTIGNIASFDGQTPDHQWLDNQVVNPAPSHTPKPTHDAPLVSGVDHLVKKAVITHQVTPILTHADNGTPHSERTGVPFMHDMDVDTPLSPSV